MISKALVPSLFLSLILSSLMVSAEERRAQKLTQDFTSIRENDPKLKTSSITPNDLNAGDLGFLRSREALSQTSPRHLKGPGSEANKSGDDIESQKAPCDSPSQKHNCVQNYSQIDADITI